MPVRAAENAVSQPFPCRAAFARVAAGADRLCLRSLKIMMISLFENNNVCHDYFSHSERLRMLIRGEWRVANGEWGRRTDYSPFAMGKAAGTKPAGAGDALGRSPSADRPRCPIAPCRARKGLKMLKTTRASYWLELASIWDRRHVRLGSAPPRLRRRYARSDGKRPWKWEQSEPVALAKSRH